MMVKKLYRLILPIVVLCQLGLFSSFALADQLVEDISVTPQANGEAIAVVKFAFPIQYLRHFPRNESTYTSIYFNIPGGAPADAWQNYESHRTPPSDVIKDINVSTRDRATGPKVFIEFYRPAEFDISIGKNNQVLIIRVMPVTSQQNKRTEPSRSDSGSIVIPPPVVPPVAAPPVITTAPVPSTPTVKAKTTVTTVASSENVTKPKVVLAPSRSKRVHIPLGGKDGLPPFPEIELFVQEGGATSEEGSLADRVAAANNQAAALMENGGNALLTGKAFAAIGSFNKVLDLPPNKYTEDAQLWIAIAKERTGLMDKAVLEFQTYLKLYPKGEAAQWVEHRLATLKKAVPAVFANLAKPIETSSPVRMQNTKFQYSEYGSLSMYYYTGASQTNATSTAGAVQTPTSFSTTDQKSLITNINMTARSYNNEYDNQLVFQDFYAANYLKGQKNTNRLGAAYYELKDRIVDYSFKIGRQSGIGGGVMGRFDGVSAGYGFYPDFRANVVVGRLSDTTLDSKPRFIGTSVDFGTNDVFGGSVYFINQKVSSITDRRAVGGNLRYYDQAYTLMSMLDYDVQFKALNMITIQGTVNGGNGGTDYNFLFDRRRSPILDLRNAVNGTAIPLATLTQNGWTTSDLVALANKRTTVASTAQVGMTNHLSETWNIGTDLSVARTDGLAASGGVPDAFGVCTATEGCVPATPATGNTWTISERATGQGIIKTGDTTNFSLSYSKGKLTKASAFQFSNHADLKEKWMLDSTLTLAYQSDNSGGKSNTVSPTARLSYQARNNLAIDGQLGVDWTKSSSHILQSTSTTKTWREYVSLGFRLDF